METERLNEKFMGRIYREIELADARRFRIELMKVVLITVILSLGGIKFGETNIFWPVLYGAPFVAVVLDSMMNAEHLIVIRSLQFLRLHSPSNLENMYGDFVKKHSGIDTKYGCSIFTTLILISSFFMIGLSKSGGFDAGDVVTFVVYVVMIIYYRRKMLDDVNKFINSLERNEEKTKGLTVG